MVPIHEIIFVNYNLEKRSRYMTSSLVTAINTVGS